MQPAETLRELVAQGKKLVPKGGDSFYNDDLQPDYVAWRLQAIAVIEELGAVAKPFLRELEADKDVPYFFKRSAARVLGTLQAALAVVEREKRATTPEPDNGRYPALREITVLSGEMPRVDNEVTRRVEAEAEARTQVFVVHGHDDALLNRVARFLDSVHLRPVILFEQPGKGQTIIEKLESNGAVSFAVVLLTPDDAGKAARDKTLRPRARQNVILELGYFMGRLGRKNVAVLYDESVDLPSDYRGVEYIKLDAEGAWKLRLARELRHAGLRVDLSELI